MSVEAVLPRLRSVIQNTLEARASSEDSVEWEVVLGMLQGDRELLLAANIYIKLTRLDEDELGVETKVFEPLPLDLCTNEYVAQWVDEAWDALVFRGMEVLLD